MGTRELDLPCGTAHIKGNGLSSKLNMRLIGQCCCAESTAIPQQQRIRLTQMVLTKATRTVSKEDSKGNSSLVFILGTGLPLWVKLAKSVSDLKDWLLQLIN